MNTITNERRIIKSTSTFKDEFDILAEEVPNALYGSEAVTDYFFTTSILTDFLFEIANVQDSYGKQEDLVVKNPMSDEPLPYFIDAVDIQGFLNQLGDRNAPLNEGQFYSIFYEYFGFSLGDAYEFIKRHGSKWNLANLIAEFGKDAFGCYLPMHAYYKSKTTPWGIYLFPELIIERAIFLYQEKNEGLEFWQHLLFYLYAVYRHELFHFHVERFATKLEIMNREPHYKPYHEKIEPQVFDSEDWLEEALAENSVLRSVLVANRTGIESEVFKAIYRYDLQFMPPGYKDYHCHKHGGPKKAMRKFSSQLINLDVNPQKITDIFTVRDEYVYPDKKVPGYIFMHPEFKERFQ